MNNYRNRIYNNYVQARAAPLAPDTTAGLKPRAPCLRRTIKRHFPKDRKASILDLGCGHGAVLFFAREAGYTNIRGIDFSPEQIAAARNLGIEKVEEGDLLNTLKAQPDRSLDAVVSFDVIEHFTRDELLDFVDEVSRVLVKGGRWIIHTPNGESPFSGRMRYWDLTHELSFTRTSIAQLLYSSGYSHVQSFEDEPVPHGFISGMRWVLWKLIRFALRFYIAIETGNAADENIFTQRFFTIAIK